MDAEKPAETGNPQLSRPHEGRWLAGVSAGLSRRLRLPVWMVRSSFILLALPLNSLLSFEWLWGSWFDWLAFPIMLSMAPFGLFWSPIGWGVVLYLTGWMIIPLKEAGIPGYNERTFNLTYLQRAIIYMAIPLITPYIAAIYVFGIDHIIGNENWSGIENLFVFNSLTFWPSMLLLAAARFRIRGTLISSIICSGLFVVLWVIIHSDDSPLVLLILAPYNTVAVPVILLVIGLSEWYHRRRCKDQPKAEQQPV